MGYGIVFLFYDALPKGEKVGEGAAGEVFLCEDMKANNAKVRRTKFLFFAAKKNMFFQVAIKKIKLTTQNLKMITVEIGMMREMDHPQIVR